jgi:hypothetical protein
MISIGVKEDQLLLSAILDILERYVKDVIILTTTPSLWVMSAKSALVI